MTKRIKTGLWLALVVVAAGLLAAITFRTAAATLLATLLAGLSGLALASGGAGKGAAAAGAGPYLPALIGAVGGAALQWRQTAGLPRAERWLLTGVSGVAAYFGGLLADGLWPQLGAGAVGLAGMIAANLAVPVINGLRVLLLALRDTLLALLADVPWLKRVIGTRLGGAGGEDGRE